MSSWGFHDYPQLLPMPQAAAYSKHKVLWVLEAKQNSAKLQGANVLQRRFLWIHDEHDDHEASFGDTSFDSPCLCSHGVVALLAAKLTTSLEMEFSY